ncbi:hypothetical protein BV20DRAFT_556496 [Pilatotrama ljubarskyi]|nr:hypothetical protein BV20DRAFT_556496 [Pilatotrama ljubarskyi]
MAYSPSLSAERHTPGASFDYGIKGWNDNSLVGALGEPSSSRAAGPHEWHISSDPISRSSSPPSPLPSPPCSVHSPFTSSCSSLVSSPTRRSATSRPKKQTTSRRAAKSPGHIPRPRNAFMIFRSARCAELKQSRVEHDHRIISKILGKMWADLDQAQKDHFNALAAEEKRLHALKYPDYRFSPQQRTEKPKKRKVKRNGLTDRKRCETVAKLLLEGKGGEDLKAEVDKFDLAVKLEGAEDEESPADYSTGVFDSRAWPSPADSPTSSSSSPLSSSPSSLAYPDSPAFRSPLLPPSATRTPAFGSPLQIPDMARLDILSPISPMQISPLESQTHAPAMAPVPLPQVADQLSASYTPVYASSTGAVGYDVVQAQPQGELGLSHLYTPRSASIAMPAEDYTYSNAAPFQHQLPSAAAAGLAGTSYFSAMPEASPVYSSGYLPESDLSTGSGAPSLHHWTFNQYAPTPFVANQFGSGELHAYSECQGYGYPHSSACVTQAGQTGDATGLEIWPYGQSSSLGLPMQGEAQPASGWMGY